jgi:hypothetical protein
MIGMIASSGNHNPIIVFDVVFRRSCNCLDCLITSDSMAVEVIARETVRRSWSFLSATALSVRRVRSVRFEGN